MYRNFHIRLFCGKGRQEPDQEEKERKPLFGFGKKRKEPSKLVSILNRYSLLFHAVLACAICFGIEWVSRHSFLEACRFVTGRGLVFLYNSLIIYASLMFVYIFKRRTVVRLTITFFWMFLGTINGCVLLKRVSPFSFTDLKLISDLFAMQSNYFTAKEATVAIVAVVLIVLALIVFWFKGPKFSGKPHRLIGVLMTAAVLLLIPSVTSAAVSNHILAEYFENLAQGYKDYGFVYSFSASVLDRGMSTPDNYSEEAVNDVVSHVLKGQEDTQADLVRNSSVRTFAAEEPEAVSDPQSADGTAAASDAQSAKEQGTVTASGVQSAEEQGTSAVSDVQSTEGQRIVSVLGAQSTEDQGTVTASGAQSTEDQGTVTASGAQKAETQGTAAVSGLQEAARISNVQNEDETAAGGETDDYPNIICVLLESFVDPTEINFLELSEDPVPNFRYLYDNYSSGHLEVPVVGAGTANTEFEILTGMGMQFFGLGEYPYKTILKQTNCESIASDLSDLGYGTHAVHNNGGNFYSRANAFSMMGFDTFTCKEMMNITEYTPIRTWPTDDILIGEVKKSLDYTPDKPDFVYTITVEGHGDYPKRKVLDNPAITVGGVEDEGMGYAWEYYVNQMHEVDDFIGDLIEMLSKRDEKTMVVMFGDHLPTMELREEDMATGSLFLTKYVTWNNFGMEKEDEDLTSYQLLAHVLDVLDIHTGTMFQYHQNRGRCRDEEDYLNGMELLQYDILYGDHYVYGGGNPYPATDLVMGTEDVVINRIYNIDGRCYVSGKNFTKWSKIYINDEKVKTKYISGYLLRVSGDVPDGMNHYVVKQLGSSETVFRTSNEVVSEWINETEAPSDAEAGADVGAD